jgi:hypothetical protein
MVNVSPKIREPQFTLAECIEKIDGAVSAEDRADLAKYNTLDDYRKSVEFGSYMLHHGFGMWIRNNCNLWVGGCDEVVEDIVRLRDSGYPVPGLEKFNFNNDQDDGKSYAYSIYHPDNCSSVIVELYHRFIRSELGLGLIERKAA